MRITPLDVRKQEFHKSVRGFDCDEVRAFLATLADEYEAVLVDNKVLRERLADQGDKITEYQTMEKTLRDTLMTAERVMQESKENAHREGHLVIQEAQLKARGIMDECRARTEELRREIVGLRNEKETYLARFKGLAEAQIDFIEAHKNDFADLDQRLIDMADGVVDGHSQHSSTQIQNEEAEGKAGGNDQWRDYNTTVAKGPSSVAASVDFAAMGVSVPAIPAVEDIDTVEPATAESEETVIT